MELFRNTRHLWILLLLILAGSAVLLVARNWMIPATYGQAQGRYGPYRRAALAQIASQPSLYQADATCLECHEEVGEERAESPHQAVRCFHCHGIGQKHVALAREAEATGGPLDDVQVWDGDFRTSMDLYTVEDQKACLVCHERVVGMPASFRSIDVGQHLEEEGAEDPESPEACFECHSGHDPAA